jgi:hypothetical protein
MFYISFYLIKKGVIKLNFVDKKVKDYYGKNEDEMHYLKYLDLFHKDDPHDDCTCWIYKKSNKDKKFTLK